MATSVNAQIVDQRIFGASSDTLTKSTSKTYTLKLEGKTPYTLSTQVVFDSISGSPSYNVYYQYSLNGSDYIGLDTIASGTGADTTLVYQNLTHFPGSTFRIVVEADTTTQKSALRGGIKTWYKY